MRKKYRSPAARTAAAAAAPARLAEESGGQALWRSRPDGELEVATVRDGRLHRHLVHDDGTVSIIDYETQQPRRHWAALSYGGFGFNLLILAGMVAGQLSVDSFPLFLIGMGVMAVGTLGNERTTDPATRLNRDPATAGEWYEPSRLGGWAPQTPAQLAAVEQLADEHNGVARVRDAGGEAVDIDVRRWGRRVRYVVDASGRVNRAERTSTGDGAPWREVRTMEEDRD